jgi:hypothetical protein
VPTSSKADEKHAPTGVGCRRTSLRRETADGIHGPSAFEDGGSDENATTRASTTLLSHTMSRIGYTRKHVKTDYNLRQQCIPVGTKGFTHHLRAAAVGVVDATHADGAVQGQGGEQGGVGKDGQRPTPR